MDVTIRRQHLDEVTGLLQKFIKWGWGEKRKEKNTEYSKQESQLLNFFKGKKESYKYKRQKYQLQKD